MRKLLITVLFTLMLVSAPITSFSLPGNVSLLTQRGNPNVRVWVNTRSRVYHCPGTKWYGKTEEGVYMTQKEAQDKNYRPAKNKECE